MKDRKELRRAIKAENNRLRAQVDALKAPERPEPYDMTDHNFPYGCRPD